MLGRITYSFHLSFQDWETNKNIAGVSNDWNNHAMEDVSKERFENGICSDLEVREIEGKLVQQLNICQTCREGAQDAAQMLPSYDVSAISEEEDQEEDLQQDTLDELSTQEDPSYDIMFANLRRIAHRQRHAQAPLIDVSKLKKKLPKVISNFDDYETGPTVEENMGIPLYIQNFSMWLSDYIQPISVWSDWKDYGYRIDNHFPLCFLSAKPYMPVEHYLPISEDTGEKVYTYTLDKWSLSRQNDGREAHALLRYMGM